MSQWHNDIIRKTIGEALSKYYGGVVNPDTTIIEFTNSPCHSYKAEYCQEFEERKKIAPNADVLLQKWKEAITNRYISPDKMTAIKNLGIVSESIAKKAFDCITSGENPSIFNLLYNLLHSEFEGARPSAEKDAEINYSNYLGESDFRKIALGVNDAYFFHDHDNDKYSVQAQSDSLYEQLILSRNEKEIALVQELLNTLAAFADLNTLDTVLQNRCAKMVHEPVDLLSFIKQFNLLGKYNPKERVKQSFDYEMGLTLLVEELETLVSQDFQTRRPDDYLDNKTYYDSKSKYREGYLAALQGHCLLFSPLYDDYGGAIEKRSHFFVYELVHGALISHHLPQLKKELNLLKSNQPIVKSSHTSKQIKPIQVDMEQRQIIYLFQQLIDNGFLNEVKNPTLWDLVAQYFTDKDGMQIKNIHQNKDGLKNTKTGRPRKNADEIDSVVKNLTVRK